MPTPKHPLVSGEIVFEDNGFRKLLRHYPNCKIVVKLEDVTAADTSSKIITRQTIESLVLHHYGNASSNRPFTIPFKLFCETIDKQRRYEISAHVDMDGDDRVSSGDYINTQSYPVIAQGYPTHISVKVVRVE